MIRYDIPIRPEMGHVVIVSYDPKIKGKMYCVPEKVNSRQCYMWYTLMELFEVDWSLSIKDNFRWLSHSLDCFNAYVITPLITSWLIPLLLWVILSNSYSYSMILFWVLVFASLPVLRIYLSFMNDFWERCYLCLFETEVYDETHMLWYNHPIVIYRTNHGLRINRPLAFELHFANGKSYRHIGDCEETPWIEMPQDPKAVALLRKGDW